MRQAFRLAVVLAAALLAACSLTAPKGDFNVTVATKTSSDPYFGMGNTVTYVINGTQGPTLTLTHGQTYTFGIDTPGHPFYISTEPIGGDNYAGEYTAGVTGSRTEFGLLTFTAPSTAMTLYYDCGVHQYMGGVINVQ